MGERCKRTINRSRRDFIIVAAKRDAFLVPYYDSKKMFDRLTFCPQIVPDLLNNKFSNYLSGRPTISLLLCDS